MGEGVNLFPRIAVVASGDAGATAPGAGADDPFSLVHLKVAEVLDVAEHPNADALYVLKVGLGSEERTICAGLRKHVPKEDLKGRKVVVVYNLKPALLRGVESQGMLLAAEGEGGKLAPVDPQGAAPGDDVRAPDLPFAPKAGLTLKDFEKAPLTAAGGVVAYKGKPLRSPAGAIRAQAPDGSTVR